MNEQELFRFEQSCESLQKGDLSSQNYLQAVSSSPEALQFCRFVLERSSSTLAQFHAVNILRTIILSDWDLSSTSTSSTSSSSSSSVPSPTPFGSLSSSDLNKITLRSQLIEFLIHSRLERVVQRQVMHAIVLFSKRGWFYAPIQHCYLTDQQINENSSNNVFSWRQSLFDRITSLLQSENSEMQMVGSNFLHVLLSEFSATKSSQMGLSCDFHLRASQSLHKGGELLQMLKQMIEVINGLMNREHPRFQSLILNNPNHHRQIRRQLLEISLQCFSDILSWDFELQESFLRTLHGSEFIRPGPAWTETLISNHQHLFSLLYTIYQEFGRQESEQIGHHIRNILTQLSSLSGTIFGPDQNLQLNFLSSLLLPLTTVFMPLTFNFGSNTNDQNNNNNNNNSNNNNFDWNLIEKECIDYSHIILRCIRNFKLKTFLSLQFYSIFLDRFSHFTCYCLQISQQKQQFQFNQNPNYYQQQQIQLNSLLRSQLLFQHLQYYKNLLRNQNLTFFTSGVVNGGGIEEEEEEVFDDSWKLECFEPLLEAWVLLGMKLSSPTSSTLLSHDPNNSIQEKNRRNLISCCSIIFDVYVRSTLFNSIKDLINEEINNRDDNSPDEPTDSSKFEEILTLLSFLGRIDINSSVNLIGSLLIDKLQALTSVWDSISSSSTSSSSSSSSSSHDELYMHVIYEEIHWLLLISGHLLADKVTSDLPEIPDPILNFFHQQQTNSNSNLYSDSDSNSIVKLSSCIISLARLHYQFLNSSVQRAREIISPQVCSSLCWFFQRWSLTYLIFDDHSQNIPENILQNYGGDMGQRGIEILEFLFSFSVCLLFSFSNEPELSLDSCQLMLDLSSKTKSRSLIPNFESYKHIVHHYQTQSYEFVNLPSKPKRKFVMCLSRIGETSTHEYPPNLHSLVNPLSNGLRELYFHEAGLTVICKNIQFIYRLNNIFDIFIGLGGGITVSNHGVLFELFKIYANHFIQTIQCFYEQPAQLNSERGMVSVDQFLLINSILKFHQKFGALLLDFLSQEDSTIFFQTCSNLIKTYAFIQTNKNSSRFICTKVDPEYLKKVRENKERQKKTNHNISIISDRERERRRDKERLREREERKLEEEERFEDIHKILKLLRVISEYIRLNSSSVSVLLSSLDTLSDIISPEILNYPQISEEFFSVLQSSFDYPQNLVQLQPNVFLKLLSTLNYALTQGNSSVKVTQRGLEALDSLSSFSYLNTKKPLEKFFQYKSDFLMEFLRLLFDLIIKNQLISDDVMPYLGSAVLSLICVEQETYLDVFSQVVHQNVPPTQIQSVFDCFENLIRSSSQNPQTSHNCPLSQVSLGVDRTTKMKFRKNFEKFIPQLRALRIK